jgi:hypothetical protein
MAYQKLQPSRAAVVVPSDTENIPNPGGGDVEGCVLYLGSGGDIRVLTAAGDDILFESVQAGFFPVQVIRVFASNLTITTNIIALW